MTEMSAPLGVAAVTDDAMPLLLEPPPPVGPPEPDPPLDPEVPPDGPPLLEFDASEAGPPLDPDAPDDPELLPDAEAPLPPSGPAPPARSWFPELEPQDATPAARAAAATMRHLRSFMGSPPFAVIVSPARGVVYAPGDRR
jgi:hypothetical protein